MWEIQKKEKQHEEGWIVDSGQEIFLRRVFLSEKTDSDGQESARRLVFVRSSLPSTHADLRRENWCQPVESRVTRNDSDLRCFGSNFQVLSARLLTSRWFTVARKWFSWSVAQLNSWRPRTPRIAACGSFLRRYPYQPVGTYFERHQQPIIGHTPKRLFFLCDTYLRVCCGAESLFLLFSSFILFELLRFLFQLFLSVFA